MNFVAMAFTIETQCRHTVSKHHKHASDTQSRVHICTNAIPPYDSICPLKKYSRSFCCDSCGPRRKPSDPAVLSQEALKQHPPLIAIPWPPNFCVGLDFFDKISKIQEKYYTAQPTTLRFIKKMSKADY